MKSSYLALHLEPGNDFIVIQHSRGLNIGHQIEPIADDENVVAEIVPWYDQIHILRKQDTPWVYVLPFALEMLLGNNTSLMMIFTGFPPTIHEDLRYLVAVSST